MKKLIIFSALVCFLLTSCDLNCTSANGDFISKEVKVDEFIDIVNYCSADIVLTQNESHTSTIIVETEENIQNLVELEVIDKQLTVNMDGCITNSEGVTIYVNLPKLSQITVLGSGDISSYGRFAQENDISLEVNGSGDIQLEIDGVNVEADINGSGDIKLLGTANKLDGSVNGSGDIEAYKLITTTADASINGSGDIELRPKDKLKATINGSGDVKYKGNPEVISSVNGSGDVIEK